MDRLLFERGSPPAKIRVDNGPEFVSWALDPWACINQVNLDFVVEKPFHAGAGIFFAERALALGLVRHLAVKSAYAASAFSNRTRSAARFSGML